MTYKRVVQHSNEFFGIDKFYSTNPGILKITGCEKQELEGPDGTVIKYEQHWSMNTKIKWCNRFIVSRDDFIFAYKILFKIFFGKYHGLRKNILEFIGPILDLNYYDDFKQTAIIYAAKTGHSAELRLLLRAAGLGPVIDNYYPHISGDVSLGRLV